MIKQQFIRSANRFSSVFSQATTPRVRRTSWGISLVCLTGLVGGHSWAQAQPYESPVLMAQFYEVAPPPPDAAIPVPSYGAMPPSVSGNQNFTGQQYVVFVNGSSDMLLDQVRLVEPTAFRTSHQGRTMIQAGRFNSPQNAQQRVRDLSNLGVNAEMAEVAAAVPYFAQGPVETPNIYVASGELPPIPTTAMPQAAEVGPNAQPLPDLVAIPATPVAPQTTLPAGATLPPPSAQGPVEFGQELSYSVPPNPNAYPVNTTPPGAAAAIPPTSARIRAPYYVIIPTRESELPEISTQIIQLGTPPDRVQQRLTPRGPHVAVGPFEDRGLAFQWNQFYQEAGLSNSRVHYDP